MKPVCPTCLGREVEHSTSPVAHHLCRSCRHRWTGAAGFELQQHYSQLSGRNSVADPDYARKMADHLSDLAPLLHNGMRVLEIGCAEGDLGKRIKALASIEYVGIELSEDALDAAKFLNRVSREPASEFHDVPYDLILSFHVLEHIPDIRAELGHWRRLLKPSGSLVVEVPNEAGHRLLSWDANAEHLHQFTASSLTALLDHAGFAIESLTSGHFESTVYPDSLRVQAYPRMEAGERRNHLVARIRAVYPGPFIVYGIGGDFRNYVLPLLPELQVSALVDSDTSRHGEKIAGYEIECFDMAKHSGLPILVTSLRYRADITTMLQQHGVPAHAIHGLDSVFG
jgi:2-polyprenyl-3-methyl-5-hydroxy-6-metoxy-1,4-benzoquinol methylase